jgi:hypothetical protein
MILNNDLSFSSPIYYNRKVRHFWINAIHSCVVLQMLLCPLATCPLCLSNIFIPLLRFFHYDLNSYLCFASAIYYNRKVCHFWINVIHPCVVLQMLLCPLSTLLLSKRECTRSCFRFSSSTIANV